MSEARRIRLISCIGIKNDLPLVDHFIAHYTELGISPRFMHFILHTSDPNSKELNQTLEILGTRGIGPAEIWYGDYTSGSMWERRRTLQAQVADEEDWIISADVDEFHQYPDDLGSVLDFCAEQGATVLQGPLIDRLSNSGKLAAIDPARSLFPQFPIEGDVMCTLGLRKGEGAGGTVKMMAFRGKVFPGIGGHNPMSAAEVTFAFGEVLHKFPRIREAEFRCWLPCRVLHFKWNSALLNGLQKRLSTPDVSAGGAKYGGRILSYLSEKGGRIDLSDIRIIRQDRKESPSSKSQLVGAGVWKAQFRQLRSQGEHLKLRQQTKVGKLRSELDKLRAVHSIEMERFEQRIEAIVSSPSWKITAPLRAASAFAKRLSSYLPRWRGHLSENAVGHKETSPSQGPLVEQGPRILQNGWRVRQLTFGSEKEQFHSHSYYDIPILDSFEQRISAYRVGFCNRQPTSEDVVTVGIVDLEKGGFTAIGESRAWSWQQGPMAQWISGNSLCWNDREDRSFIARIFDFKEGITRTLPRPIYAVDPSGRFGLSINMARLEKARPGYGYSGGAAEEWDKNCPSDDGVWRIDLTSGHCQLILPLAHALEFLRSRTAADEWTNHSAEQPMYWFNHIKLSPDGRRFTVKFRWRSRDLNLPWRDSMGVSLTCNVDGSGVRLLARATSHVMWLDSTTLYFWDAIRKCITMVDDSAPEGTFIHDLVPDLIRSNAHLRHFPNSPHQFVYDTPYRERINLLILDLSKSSAKRIARFTNHVPRRGPFRCDLHPVPSFDGSRIIVASLQDGGRQIYVLERDTSE